jgi:hypothetical protein
MEAKHQLGARPVRDLRPALISDELILALLGHDDAISSLLQQCSQPLRHSPVNVCLGCSIYFLIAVVDFGRVAGVDANDRL